MPRAPIHPFPGAPPSQPYAIPTRGAVHGPVGGVPHGPPPGSRGFGAGRGGAAPIGSHLPHQQGTQQTIGGSNFNFPPLENANSQPSAGGQLSQPGFVNNVCSYLVAHILPHKALLFSLLIFTSATICLLIEAICCKNCFVLAPQLQTQGSGQAFRDGFSMGGMSQVCLCSTG